MQNTENMPRPEIILVADTVAREKNIERDDVLEAMEIAIQKAARSKYGFEHDIRAHIDRKNGAISLAHYLLIGQPFCMPQEHYLGFLIFPSKFQY